MSRCFSTARARDEVERRLDALAQVERLRLDVHAPGLDLREVEDVVDDREQRVAGVADGRRRSRAARSSSLVSSSRPLMPMTAFIGVRISWLIVARNELFASLAASAAARASCVSLNRRTFWIAITAWSAKVCARATSWSSKRPVAARRITMQPMAAPSRSNGTNRPTGNPARAPARACAGTPWRPPPYRRR